MSRSNPTENAVHPCERWMEWDGANGGLRYYDKETKTRISVPENLTFILLDALSTVKGWHDPSESGIFSNEVRDVRKDDLFVKAYKGGPIADGLYSEIKERVNAAGGHFVANLYIAFKLGDKLAIGSIQFKGAGLKAWMEFQKANRAELLKKAIAINGCGEGKKGKVVFKFPKFVLKEIKPETDAEACALDKTLQVFLASYLQRSHHVVDRPAVAMPQSKSSVPQGEPLTDEYLADPQLGADFDIPINDIPF